MNMTICNICILVSMLLFSACEKEKLYYNSGDIEINIETGKHWLHDFPLFMGITKKNAPQFAIWTEDTCGNYLYTVFVTYKIATEGWVANNNNRRKEALPHWCHQRGVVYSDGLMLPTKKNPLTDGITGATPKNNKIWQLRLAHFNKPIVIKAEFNHSIDFNNFFLRNAHEGDDNYSGGKYGSGQPAVIYTTTIYPDTKSAILELTGHSSSDGSDGKIHYDLEKLTTALSIIKSIKATIK